jgi:hypothetical protein
VYLQWLKLKAHFFPLAWMRFIADCAYRSDDSNMLSFNVGDVIQVLRSDDDWWFGTLLKEGRDGWFPPTYGSLEELDGSSTSVDSQRHSTAVLSKAYGSLSGNDRLIEAVKIFNKLVDAETKFVDKLKKILDAVVDPLQLRDTSFKRTLMGVYSVAVSFTLLGELYSNCSSFITALRSASNNKPILPTSTLAIANCVFQFAPSLRIYGQYISENSNVLNTMKSYSLQLNEFLSRNPLPSDITLESSLILPVEHYAIYRDHYERFAFLCRGSGGSAVDDAIDRSLEILSACVSDVDNLLAAEREKHILLAVQSQCMHQLHHLTFNSDISF